MIQFLISPQCLNCSSFSVEEHLFCKFCFEKIIEPKLLASELKNDNHVYLFSWTDDDPQCFSQLIYRLKNRQSEKAMQYYCNLLISALTDLNISKNNNLLIPIPGSKKAVGHSDSIAKNLEQNGWGIYFAPLVKKQYEQQKYLNRKQRAEKHFYLKSEHEDFTMNSARPHLASQRFLFIDDVLTTGQSFKSCTELLNADANSLCITLFYRLSWSKK